MFNNKQDKFILTPILNILEETRNACYGIGNGIETQSLCEYVMQTTFLKMTGASEQKLKCICWEMATNDYAYRYHYLKKNYGECSSYEDKCSVYSDLLKEIKKNNPEYDIETLFEDIDITPKLPELIQKKIKKAQKNQEGKKKRKLTDSEVENMTRGMTFYYNNRGLCDEEKAACQRIVFFEGIEQQVCGVVNDSLISSWNQHNYATYIRLWNSLSDLSFAHGDVLLCKELQNLYSERVYVHRNRCAHNLTSYQDNLPTLKTLLSEDYVYDNYFFYFSILILLDEIFMRLYRVYRETIDTAFG